MEPIPDELNQFILASFETVDQLRILLLLRASPAHEWSLVDVSNKLYLRPDVAQEHLAVLEQKGFLAVADGTGVQYRYQPTSAEIAKQVSAVAELDRTRPVTLIKLIYRKT